LSNLDTREKGGQARLSHPLFDGGPDADHERRESVIILRENYLQSIYALLLSRKEKLKSAECEAGPLR
jgi:hypothetical protein